MSITVADCLTFPSLKETTVAGGAAGLNKIVASVSVLEYAEVSMLSKDLFVGNELMITAFVTAKDDVQKQCDVLRHLFNQGVVAAVLYYVGVIVPRLDEKLIALADELGMPLITTPYGSMAFRYADAIRDIIEAILFDNLHEKYFVPSIIERVAQFPERQRNLDNVLRILGDRFHISIMVTDEQMKLVSKAFWPITKTFDIEGLMAGAGGGSPAFSHGSITEIGTDEERVSVFYSAIHISGNKKMYVFAVIDEDSQSMKALDQNTLIQISESIQLIMSMQRYSDWSQSSNLLVNAIMNDDAYRTAQIAAQSDIDIKAIDNMWVLIISDAGEGERSEMLTTHRMLQVKTFLSDRYKTAFVGSYEESIICLMSEASVYDTQEPAPAEFLREALWAGEMILLSFSDLQTRMDARRAYDAAQEGWFTLRTIYRDRSIFYQQDLNFALTCRKLMQQDDNAVREYTAILDPLSAGSASQDLIDTLTVFLLDADSSAARTAKLLHVHPNTVKYRLRDIQQKLKRDIVKLPDAYELYLAAALLRLKELG